MRAKDFVRKPARSLLLVPCFRRTGKEVLVKECMGSKMNVKKETACVGRKAWLRAGHGWRFGWEQNKKGSGGMPGRRNAW